MLMAAALYSGVAMRPSCCLNCGSTSESGVVGMPSLVVLGGGNPVRLIEELFARKKRPRRRMGGVVGIPCRPRVHTARVSVEQTYEVGTDHRGADKPSAYLFRSEVGGLVKVSVGKNDSVYVVMVDAASIQVDSHYGELILSGSTYRSDSAAHMTSFDAPFRKISPDRHFLELEFDADKAPFFLSFQLRSASTTGSPSLEIRTHRKTKFCVPVGLSSGKPFPLGMSFSANGSVNFSIFSRNAVRMLLQFYEGSSADVPALELDLDPYVNRSGDIWHVSLPSSQRYASYDYLCMENSSDKFGPDHGLLDPYAKLIEKSASTSYRGKIVEVPSFDWTGDFRPNIPPEKLTMYRLNVKRFTDHESSEVPDGIAGTFSGVAEKSYHFKQLGVNAVLLEPVFTYDERKGPYFPFHFFSPSDVLGPSDDSTSSILSMKEMVKRLHSDGIEVFLEVVFTHTAETCSLQGIDNSSYYNVTGSAKLKSQSSLSCNYPIVQQLVLDSLRYWVIDFHIDGFCFTNASSLMRGVRGEFLSRPALIEAIAFDPILARTKIIADCWDPIDGSYKDTRFPHWKRWGEMNAKFCTDVRKFLKGEGVLSDLATRLCGSGDVFSNGRGPAYSFNFISQNFGLSLVDLVSFSKGELASQFSWNCGEEGPTNKDAVLERRLKQIRNFIFILFISLGIPVLNMGDECGQSTGGSPAYSARKSYDWNLLKTPFSTQMSQFISFLNSFRRRRSDLLQKGEFQKAENIEWHGSDQSPPKWEDPSSRFLAMTLRVESENPPGTKSSSEAFGDLFIAFNVARNPERLILPVLPEGMVWHCLVDTALPYPGFFSDDGELVLEQMKGLFTYEMKSHTCTLFEARQQSD